MSFIKLSWRRRLLNACYIPAHRLLNTVMIKDPLGPSPLNRHCGRYCRMFRNRSITSLSGRTDCCAIALTSIINATSYSRVTTLCLPLPTCRMRASA